MIKENFNFGYACLNTELRKQNIFMSRTCRLATLKKNGLEYVKNLAIENLKDILKILKWNKENDIYFMRLSSEIFPFASHKELGYDISFADSFLKEIGDYANLYNMRLTMHPAQHCVLSSKDKNIVENTIKDLNLHATILDKMNIGKNGVMIIHGGFNC